MRDAPADSHDVPLAVWKQTSERRVELWRDREGRSFVRKIHLGRKGGRRAAREAAALQRLRSAGIPAPELLALRVATTQGELDMEWLRDYRPLEQLFPPCGSDRRAARAGLRHLAGALELVQRALAAGVWELDFHAGNIMVGPGGELALIDLHRARTILQANGPLPRPLHSVLGRLARRLERRFLRFFLPYLNARSFGAALNIDAAAAEVRFERVAASRRRLLRGKDRRASGAHRSFEQLQEEHGAWICECGTSPTLRSHALAIATHRQPSPHVYKARARAAVLAVDEDHLIKLYLGSSWAALRRARSAWRASLALRHSRVRSHRALGLWTASRRALLLCERGPGQHLADWIYGTRPAVRAQVRVARELARSLAILHRDGLRLRDLRAENFLLDAELHVFRIDFDGIPSRKRSALSWARSAGDLARLRASFPPPAPISTMAVEHFVRCYATERGLSCAHLRRWRQLAAQRVEAFWKLWRQRGYVFDADGIHENR